jgi:hypothetical protein
MPLRNHQASDRRDKVWRPIEKLRRSAGNKVNLEAGVRCDKQSLPMGNR